jgi:pyruvate-formate lyase
MVDSQTLNKSSINPLIFQALEFTETYIKHKNDPISIREAMCLKKQYPALLGEIRSEDLLAGRRSADRIIYTGSIWWMAFPTGNDGRKPEGKQGGYCFDGSALDRLPKTETEKKILEDLTAFWRDESTICKLLNSMDDRLKRQLQPGNFISSNNVGFSLAVDLDRLLRRGIPGLIEDVTSRKLEAEKNGEDTSFFAGLLIAVDVIADSCRYFEKQAKELASKSKSIADKERLEDIANTLSAIIDHAPGTFREAVQLLWMYLVISAGKHPEMWGLDIALGDFYAKDIDNGIITENEALDLLLCLWRLINETGDDATCRISIGGKGRHNEANANRFAIAAMEATKRHRRVTPQLMLRIYRGQDPELLKKAYDAINGSCTFPMLYNDDEVMPGVARIFGISEDEALKYHPLGCGEYMIACSSPSLLDCNWNIPKTIEAVLLNGSTFDGIQAGPRTGDIASLDTFEKFYDAFMEHICFGADIVARSYQEIRDLMAKECAFLYGSLLTDDCLKRGRSAFDGGMRYMGACVMGHGFTNAADSLTSIKKLVYKEKHLTLEQLLAALLADFEGHESVRKMLLDIPKFGNNDDEADQMLVHMWQDISQATKEAGKKYGFDFLNVSSVNPGGFGMGFTNGATADGRKKGQAFAVGNSPTAGNDKCGLTALFNTLAKVDPANGGAVTNFKISREFFTEERPKLEALFGAFFAKGGVQATITVVNRDDLEAAMKEPEKYPHVLVRLGGWTSRFIDLEPKIQVDILRRTLY